MQYIIKFFNNWYSFCALDIFSLWCLLKSNFWYRCKHKCFWKTLHSTETSFKKTWGWKGFIVFQEKITSWVFLVRSGLNIFFHWYVYSEILFKSLLISSVETLMSFTIEKIDVSSAKSLTFDIKLLGRSFMYIKSSNGHKIDPCCTPASISSQWEFGPLCKTLWHLLSRKCPVSY